MLAVVICGIMLIPVYGLASLALSGADDIWTHLFATVLPLQTITTLSLIMGVATLTAFMGTSSAWFVTFFDFPGRGLFVWAMLLPLAIPTYIAAYSYADILDYAGPLYRVWQSYFSPDDYPQIHSLGGAIFILSFVLYPYVYISARTSFIQQSTGLIENARLLGHSPNACFWRVALPLARPAIALGMLLAAMECLNDIGAMEHLGVQTLTIGVYNVWINQGSLAGAAQLALAMLGFVALLVIAEHGLRRLGGFQSGRLRSRSIRRFSTSTRNGFLMTVACAIPILIGFIIPVSVLSLHAQKHKISGASLTAASNSIGLALLAALFTLALALFLAYSRRSAIPQGRGHLARLASLGYAIPGTVLGIGLLVIASYVSKLTSGGLIITGTIIGLIYAYSIRFLSLAYGTIDDGFERLPRTIDLAARSLGASRSSVMWRIHTKLMRPPIIAASLLVFVDAMKELPATLILRPFNFETLSTEVYTQASLGLIEQAAAPALIIIGIGLIPIIVMLRLLDKFRG